MRDLGDRTEDSTIDFTFHTTNESAAPTTLAGTPAISVYKANGTTQSTAGVTLTADFDSVTGLNHIRIDLSADAFYAVGNDYSVVITTGTVNSISVVGATVATFSIENRFDEVDVTQWLGTAPAALTDTDKVQVSLQHGTGSTLTSVPWNSSWDTEVQSECNDALVALNLDHLVAAADFDDVVDDSIIAKLANSGATADWSAYVNTTDSLMALRDRGDSAWTTGAGGSDRLLMVDTTIATLSSQTSFTLTAGSADDDAYNNCTIVIEDASTATQKAVGLILDYTGSSKTVTLKYDPAIFTMAATDKVYILAENALKSTAANRQLDVTATGAAGIDWANVENPTTAVDLSGTDIQLCDTVTTNTDMVGTDSAALASVCTEARLAELDAANLPADMDAVLLDTGTTIPATITTAQADLDTITGSDGVTLATTQGNYAPLKPTTAGRTLDVTAGGTAGIDWANVENPTTAVDLSQTDIQLCDTVTTNTDAITVASILTTQMTESYAANEVAPTLAQGIFAIHQALMSFTISSTTYTARQLNNTSTAFVITLDDATSPTTTSRD